MPIAPETLPAESLGAFYYLLCFGALSQTAVPGDNSHCVVFARAWNLLY
jgi:hypothetical protein